MREPWIRVRAHLSDAKVAQRLAVICRGDAQKAAGVLIDFWSSVSENATDGMIRDYPSHTLEDWAKWRGKRGAFAAWVRANHMDADGRVKEWDDYMGALESRREADRQRKELDRIRRKSSGQPNGHPPDIQRRSAPTRADEDGYVDVNGTANNQPTNSAREATPGETAFLEAVPAGREGYWRAIIASWYSGQGYPQGKAADPRDVSAGLLEYLATSAHDFAPRHVRAFVMNAEAQRLTAGTVRPPRNRNPKSFLEVE